MDNTEKKAPQTDNKKERSGVGKLQLAKTTILSAGNVLQGSHEQALQRAILTGIKMASGHPFSDPLANPLSIAAALKKLGLSALTWAPETLCAEIDRQFNNWDDAKVADALAYFHKYGVIKSDIPQLVREKIYAIRVVATSDSAHTEWHVFEKVGGAFNDRTAKFGVVEPLSAAECARTIATMENIRPDSYSDEVKIYIAACCHEAGLLTVEPLSWLSISESYLQRMNKDAMEEQITPEQKQAILSKYEEEKNSRVPREIPDEVTAIQAAKLVAINSYAAELTES